LDDIDLTNKSWTIFGRKGGGKSWLTKHILDSTPNHWIYDPLGEHAGYNQYIPTDRESIPELEVFTLWAIDPANRPALLVVDEGNRYMKPKPTPLPKGISELNDFNRHWGISFGCVARRPVQFHTDLVELSEYVFFFPLSGVNNFRFMDDLYDGLADAVKSLPDHGFVSVHDGKTLTVHPPIDEPRHVVHT